MIPEARVKAQARHLGVDPLVIDRDHALGVVLCALARAGVEAWGWVFKGGTCLRKAYFPDYRFSEDLDFTCVDPMSPEDAGRRIAQLAPASELLGVRLLTDRLRIDDKSGGEEVSLEIRVPYEGAVRRSGPPPNLQVHLSFDETLAFAVVSCPLIHPYDDGPDVACVLPCYSLEEILVEKLRAICGQRRFAIARDLYDIWKVTVAAAEPGTASSDRAAVNIEAALRAVPEKAAAVGLGLTDALERLDARYEEYRANWDAGVVPLAPKMAAEAFDQAWATARGLVERVTPTGTEIAPWR